MPALCVSACLYFSFLFQVAILLLSSSTCVLSLCKMTCPMSTSIFIAIIKSHKFLEESLPFQISWGGGGGTAQFFMVRLIIPLITKLSLPLPFFSFPPFFFSVLLALHFPPFPSSPPSFLSLSPSLSLLSLPLLFHYPSFFLTGRVNFPAWQLQGGTLPPKNGHYVQKASKI